MSDVDPKDWSFKRILLGLSPTWNPQCEECGLRHEHVRSEWYTITTKKDGYTLKRTRWGRICRYCLVRSRYDSDVIRFAGVDCALGQVFDESFVYAPYIPEAFTSPQTLTRVLHDALETELRMTRVLREAPELIPDAADALRRAQQAIPPA